MGATAATLTPIPAGLQARARALHAKGRKAKAIAVLREGTGLGMAHAASALRALLHDGHLPASIDEAADRLAADDPRLHASTLAVLREGGVEAAALHLRDAAYLDLANARRLAEHLKEPQAEPGQTVIPLPRRPVRSVAAPRRRRSASRCLDIALSGIS